MPMHYPPLHLYSSLLSDDDLSAEVSHKLQSNVDDGSGHDHMVYSSFHLSDSEHDSMQLPDLFDGLQLLGGTYTD